MFSPKREATESHCGQSPRHVDTDRDRALLWGRASSDANAHIVGYVTRAADCRAPRAHLYVERINAEGFSHLLKGVPTAMARGKLRSSRSKLKRVGRREAPRGLLEHDPRQHFVLRQIGL
jgi:hypothetical protein